MKETEGLLLLMEKALSEELSLEFPSNERAQNVRFQCYKLRDFARASGDSRYDKLGFAVRGNVLTISMAAKKPRRLERETRGPTDSRL